MIHFFAEDIDFKIAKPIVTRRWIRNLVSNEGFALNGINYVFCSDDYLLEMNRSYLQHDYYTDVITFDNSEEERKIEGDIFISIDRVRDNAVLENASFDHELRRVLAHGALHLCGYGDASASEKENMREKENLYLSKFNN